MSSKIKYTNEPIGKVEVVQDFLPSPQELAFREEGVKVTLALSKRSVDFFKSEASTHRTQYQRMIRKLLDAYVDSQEALARRSNRRGRPPPAPRLSLGELWVARSCCAGAIRQIRSAMHGLSVIGVKLVYAGAPRRAPS
jgi:predicted DNA binding CopG/RHH family protein